MATIAATAAVLVLLLAGSGPFHSSNGSASDQCRWVSVERTMKTPIIVHVHGKDQVRFVPHRLSHFVQRCH